MSPRPLPRSYKSQHRHARLFWVACLLALAIGIPIRSWLSHPHVRELVTAHLSRVVPVRDHWSADAIVISLANGWWPELAIELRNISYQTAGCAGVRVEADKLSLPLSLTQWWQGHLALGVVRVQQLRVHLPTPCEKAPSVAATTDVKETRPGLPEVHEDPFAVAVGKFRATLSRLEQSHVLAGLRIDHVEIFPSQQDQPWVLRRISLLDLAGDAQASFEGILQFPNWAGWSERLPQVNFWGDADSTHVNLEMRGHWREGTFILRADMAGEPGHEHLQLKTSLTHLPLFQVSEVVEKLSRTRHDMRPRLAWLSCEGELAAEIAETSRAQLIVRPCQIEGALGRVHVPEVKLSWSEGLQVEGLQARFEQVSIDALLELARVSPPTRGVISSLGQLNGSLELSSHQVMFKGDVANLDLLFSNFGRRAVQKVDRLKAEITLDKNRLKGAFTEFDLRDGQAQGSAHFDVSTDLAQGQFDLRFQLLEFAPYVEQLVTSGHLEGLQFSGRGTIAQGKLANWDGTLELAQVSRADFLAQGVKLRADSQTHKLAALLNVQSLQLQPAANELQWFTPILEQMGEAVHTEPLRVKAELSIADRIFSWRGLQMMAVRNPRFTLISNGGWNDSQDMRGWFQVAKPTQTQRWILSGARNEPVLASTKLSLAELSEYDLPALVKAEAPTRSGASLATQVMGQIRSWLPRFGRTPSSAGANP